MIETSGDVYDLFRSDVFDATAPYMWSDMEVYNYMNDAYRMFVRKTGGVPDTSSPITQLQITAGQIYTTVSPLILRFREAWLQSNGDKVTIINDRDDNMLQSYDYGQMRPIIMDTRPGPVRYMQIGLERNQGGGKVRWIQVPTVSDVCQTTIYRLPLTTIDDGDDSFTFPDIGAEHIEHLTIWMKARAYGKQDSEVFNKVKRDEYKAEFDAYCSDAKKEWERYKHKTRVVRYGGIGGYGNDFGGFHST